LKAERLNKTIDFSLPENDAETEADVLENVLDMIYKSKNPVLIADACCIRHHVVDETLQLIHKLQITGFVTPMGKGAIDESNPHYGGVYVGAISLPEVKQAVESSDCVLSVGALLSDFNTVRIFQLLFFDVRDLSVITLARIRPSNFTLLGLRFVMRLIPELE